MVKEGLMEGCAFCVEFWTTFTQQQKLITCLHHVCCHWGVDPGFTHICSGIDTRCHSPLLGVLCNPVACCIVAARYLVTWAVFLTHSRNCAMPHSFFLIPHHNIDRSPQVVVPCDYCSHWLFGLAVDFDSNMMSGDNFLPRH